MEAARMFLLSGSPPSEQENKVMTESAAKKTLFSSLSPMDCAQTERAQLQSDTITPKRKLSLNQLDESTQSPYDCDIGYGESVNSCSSMEYSLNNELTECTNEDIRSTTRSPLGVLDTNSPSESMSISKRTLLAKRRKKKTPSFHLLEDKMNSPRKDTAAESSRFRFPPLSIGSSSSLPFSQTTNSADCRLTKSSQGSGRSWIQQISSPLERMTLVSPTGQVTCTGPFSFLSASGSTCSLQSQPGRSESLPSNFESDGYFSEIDVFENDSNEMQVSETISNLINAPLHSANSPNHIIVDSFADRQKELACPTPVRPLILKHSDSFSNISPLCQSRGSLKRSNPTSAFGQLTKRPPLPFLHCSNSQDYPSTPPRDQLKGRSLLRSQSYCTPLGGDVVTSPFSPGEGELLIGDDSKPYALPLTKGSCAELKCISSETLSKLIAGKYKDVVDTYTIIDSRYPFEYFGGHIQGAVNIWEKGDLLEKFFSNPNHPRENHRKIYLFHCEFSSKRGPEMCRFLREIDRKKNGMEFFPKLYYPELYLIDGGYKTFYQTYSELCEPRNYCPMIDEKFKEDLRHCKLRAKSWAGDSSILQSRRQVPSRCRRRATVYFESRDKGL